MKTILKKHTTVSKKDTVIILFAKKPDWSLVDFSKAEKEYIQGQLKAKKTFIAINQYQRWVFIHLLTDKKEAHYKTLENSRKMGCSMLKHINKHGIREASLIDATSQKAQVLAYTEGILLANYQFLKYQKEKKENALKTLKVHSRVITDSDLTLLQVVTQATCKARDLVNEPHSYLTAEQLAKEFQQLAKESGFKIEVLNKAKIKALKMGGLLAVNQGSINPPSFSIMEWKPKNAVNKKPFVLVGKGVVYDTGGLSLKPTSNSMDKMKCDMAGAAVVGGILYAIARTQLPIHVIGLVPATDNRPGENAYAPGDVIKMHNGMTVEMLNADAEGRMILADALSYAKQYNPELVFDFATLTGSAAVAIGPYGTVCMGTADEKVKSKLKTSGENTYERVVEFPFWEEYDELIKSDIADIKNIGPPYAGAITAGKFLQRFVSYPWMHFDIAGSAFIDKEDSYRGKNGTGVGVRLLFDFFKNHAEKK